MNTLRKSVPVMVLLLISLSSASAQVADSESVRHDVFVYRDGVVLVVQQFKINQSVAQISVPLLSPSASSIFATDKSKAPMAFDLAGRNITVHTLGVTAATVEYQVADITGKDGAVWTLKMNLLTKANLTLPELATITFLNAIPETISLGGGKPVLLLGPGFWEISYTLPVTVQQQPDPQAQPQPALSLQTAVNLSILWIPAVGVAAVIGAFLVYRMKRFSQIDTDVKLRPEEEALLNFLAESGKKALESDLRKKFVIPKTSMWRMSKRLERLGYVRINRYGSQNELELLKKP